MEISREQRELGLSGMRRNPTGLWWGRDPRACLDPGQKSFAHNGGLEASALCLADEGICLGMGNQEREERKSPLQGQLGTNRISVVRDEPDDRDDSSAQVHFRVHWKFTSSLPLAQLIRKMQ